MLFCLPLSTVNPIELLFVVTMGHEGISILRVDEIIPSPREILISHALKISMGFLRSISRATLKFSVFLSFFTNISVKNGQRS